MRRATENDLEENRENLGPLQSPDGVAANVSGRDYADFAGRHPAEIVRRHLAAGLGLRIGFLLRSV